MCSTHRPRARRLESTTVFRDERHTSGVWRTVEQSSRHAVVLRDRQELLDRRRGPLCEQVRSISAAAKLVAGGGSTKPLALLDDATNDRGRILDLPQNLGRVCSSGERLNRGHTGTVGSRRAGGVRRRTVAGSPFDADEEYSSQARQERLTVRLQLSCRASGTDGLATLNALETQTTVLAIRAAIERRRKGTAGPRA